MTPTTRVYAIRYINKRGNEGLVVTKFLKPQLRALAESGESQQLVSVRRLRVKRSQGHEADIQD